jgi:hypothetical protein
MNDQSFIDFLKIRGYPELIGKLQGGIEQIPLSLPRSVRLPFMSALQETQPNRSFYHFETHRLLSMREYEFGPKPMTI